MGKEPCVENRNFPFSWEKRKGAENQGDGVNWELQKMKEFLKISRLGDPGPFCPPGTGFLRLKGKCSVTSSKHINSFVIVVVTCLFCFNGSP